MVTAFIKANGLSVMNCRGALPAQEVQGDCLSELQLEREGHEASEMRGLKWIKGY